MRLYSHHWKWEAYEVRCGRAQAQPAECTGCPADSHQGCSERGHPEEEGNDQALPASQERGEGRLKEAPRRYKVKENAF